MSEDMQNENLDLSDGEAQGELTEQSAPAAIYEDGAEDTSAPSTNPTEDVGADGEDTVDYEEMARQDLDELKEEFPELSGLNHVAELDNAQRYAALRDLGLSAAEAYLASNRRKPVRDSRSHLSSAAPRGAVTPAYSCMSHNDLVQARELFSDLSDAEIQKLYRRVTE